MARQVNTRRQKDISRLLREKRQAYPDKIKTCSFRPIQAKGKTAHEK